MFEHTCECGHHMESHYYHNQEGKRFCAEMFSIAMQVDCPCKDYKQAEKMSTKYKRLLKKVEDAIKEGPKT